MSTKLKAGTATSGAVLDADTTGILELQTGSTPTTAVNIDASQNVQIGSTAPATTGMPLTIARAYNASTAPIGSAIALQRTDGTDVLGSIGFYNSAGTKRYAIETNVTVGAGMEFNYGASNKMYLDTTGNLLIGTSTSPPSAGGVIATKGAGTSIYFTHGSNNLTGTTNFVVYNGSNTGVYLINGQTSWSANSDLRLKNITGKYETPLADISKIEPIKFTWKSDETNEPKVGVIAQSVIDIVPEAVGKSKLYENDETEYLSVRYTELIPLLIASIQELNAKVTALEEQVINLGVK